jgi:hypothetical protein
MKVFLFAALFALAGCKPAEAPGSGPPPGMVLIPGGDFLMGSNAEYAYGNEKPAHRVEVAARAGDKGQPGRATPHAGKVFEGLGACEGLAPQGLRVGGAPANEVCPPEREQEVDARDGGVVVGQRAEGLGEHLAVQGDRALGDQQRVQGDGE